MSPAINEEILLLCMSVYGGLVLILCYDVIRILRRVFRPSLIRTVVEDIVFWTVASIYVFQIFLKYNYGRPRYYAVAAVLGTMILFEWFWGRHLIKKASRCLEKIFHTLLKPLKKVKKTGKLRLHQIKKFLRKKVRKCQTEEMSGIHKKVTDRERTVRPRGEQLLHIENRLRNEEHHREP